MWLSSLFTRLGTGPASIRPRPAAARRMALEVLEGRAVPAFLLPVLSPGGSGIAADFNNDGRDDLVRLIGAADAGVRLSAGDGTFLPELVTQLGITDAQS